MPGCSRRAVIIASRRNRASFDGVVAQQLLDGDGAAEPAVDRAHHAPEAAARVLADLLVALGIVRREVLDRSHPHPRPRGGLGPRRIERHRRGLRPGSQRLGMVRHGWGRHRLTGSRGDKPLPSCPDSHDSGSVDVEIFDPARGLPGGGPAKTPPDESSCNRTAGRDRRARPPTADHRPPPSRRAPRHQP